MSTRKRARGGKSREKGGVMPKAFLRSALLGSVCALAFAAAAHAETFNVPAGALDRALQDYTAQSGIQLFIADDAVRGVRTRGVAGNLSAEVALARILEGTGLIAHSESGAIAVVRAPQRSRSGSVAPVERIADATPARASTSVETVVVTSSKIKGDIQTVPIAITALSQEQLTSRQIAGGPDLVKEVPNLTFTKTNFSGYSIQIRGIGTQAISVTTDPAVAVALNDTPFIRNHFFEQEFYDLNQAEVLRGPQGTLYGRNATAGVVNLITAKPTDQFEAMLSADWGNYTNRRYEGMVNIPIVDDRLDLRVAGEWTKRDGYSFNALTNKSIDGRDLWSSRITLGWHPLEHLQTYLVWEHFSEDDDRLRSAKQLCKTAPIPTEVGGVLVPGITNGGGVVGASIGSFLSQSCQAVSLYSPEAFEVPNGYSLPYYSGLSYFGLVTSTDPYLNTTQSRNLRVIESQIEPAYKAKNDVVELNTDYDLTPSLTLTSQSGYNQDFLWSTEDYNRFASSPGVFTPNLGAYLPGSVTTQDGSLINSQGVFCDPQLGCSDRILAEDLNDEHAWQASQEFRLASHFAGPLNFSAGGNYMHYETEENYYVFVNSLTIYSYWQDIATPGMKGGPQARLPWVPGVSDNSQCLFKINGFSLQNPANGGGSPAAGQCIYIDPNPISSLNSLGHNYFLSKNPYTLNSYAAFGETYYDILKNLKLTGGLRWTEDRKHFIDLPSEVIASGVGFPSTGTVDQKWDRLTGRAALNWSPQLEFTDQTLLYGSYAHGYKAGGANPPGAVLEAYGVGSVAEPIHPLTFKPEYVDAFEAGMKNTLLDGGLTLNGDVFYYNYKDYQISEIVDRTAINNNFNAQVIGAEVEAAWEPIPGLRFNASGGYENTRVANGEHAIDLMDRTAGNPDWIVVKPFLTQASNCILPVYVVAAMLAAPYRGSSSSPNPAAYSCGTAYGADLDPMTGVAYHQNPTGKSTLGNKPTIPAGYPGFDPLSVDPTAPANVNGGLGLPPNNGEGFDKDLSGNQLPNAPHFTTSLSADYTMPISANWAASLHGDFYWQSQSWARIFNDNPYDKLRGYSNVNLALTLASAGGLQVMGYVKNVFNVTAITGDFLNSDDSGLTTNVFLTDPRLFGVRITKNW